VIRKCRWLRLVMPHLNLATGHDKTESGQPPPVRAPADRGCSKGHRRAASPPGRGREEHRKLRRKAQHRLYRQRAAFMYSLIVTAKLNDIDPQAWLADVLARIADHPAHQLEELLLWNWRRHSPSAISHAA
jgi:hypothetical protein